MPKQPTTKVTVKLVDFMADGGPYKPNSPHFQCDILVQVEVPTSHVICEDPLTLTPYGAAYVMSEIRSKVNQSYLED